MTTKVTQSTLESLLREDSLWQSVKKVSPEKVELPCPFSGHGNDDIKMSVVISSSKFSCKDCQLEGDSYSYLLNYRHLTDKKAIKLLTTQHKWSDAKIAHSQQLFSNSKTTAQGQPNAYQVIPEELRKNKLSSIHRYTDKENKELFSVVKYEIPSKTESQKPKLKTVIFTKKSNDEGYWSALPTSNLLAISDRIEKFPLYNLHNYLRSIKGGKEGALLQDRKQVWVLDNEMVVDKAVKLLGVYPCVSVFSGHLLSADSHDLSPLYSENVLLISDDNEKSRTRMLNIASHLHQHGCAVRTVLPKGSGGASIIGPLESGQMENVKKWIERVKVEPYLSKPDEKKKDIGDIIAQLGLPDNEFFRVLGTQESSIAVLVKRSRVIHLVKASSITNVNQLAVFASVEWWMEQALGNKFDRVSALSFGSAILRSAERMGVAKIDTSSIGRGAHYSKKMGEYVFNLGNRLLMEDESGYLSVESSFDDMEDELFVAAPSLPLQLNIDNIEAEEICHALSKCIEKYRWNDRHEARAYYGWLVTSLIGGALSFRPMMLLIAEANFGKTFLIADILKNILGEYVRHETGTNEAGIADKIKNDSLPVILDEFEPKDEGNMAQNKCQAILSLIRQATSGDGRRTRSSATGSVREVVPRFSAFASATKQMKMTAADLQRFYKISLSAERLTNVEWLEYEAEVKGLLSERSCKIILSYIIRNTRKIVEKAEELEKEYAEKYPENQTRQNKILSALTAGAGFLSGDYTDIQRIESDSIQGDQFDLLNEILESVITVQYGRTLTITECLQYAFWCDGQFVPAANISKTRIDEATIVNQYGLKMEEEGILLIATSHKPLEQLIKKTRYGNIDYRSVIMNISGVDWAWKDEGEKNPDEREHLRSRFGGKQKRCLAIPNEILMKVGFEPPNEGDIGYRSTSVIDDNIAVGNFDNRYSSGRR